MIVRGLPGIAMSYSYFSMWGLLILMGLGAAGGLMHGGDAYPSDTAQQEALRRCGEADASFSRFSANDRQACYKVMLHTTAIAAR